MTDQKINDKLDGADRHSQQRLVSAGDYVLATKWGDGDPQDHWCIGFYSHQEGDRYFVVNDRGEQFRANGFRRVKKISANRGFWILRHRQAIEHSGKSMWHFARCRMVDCTNV